ncbi:MULTISPECIES: hypothetical protein [unclassified Mycobacterium]|uniref:hypothetical protein n=1 Tax=unclassified Mycobacterium TaxID=2642494 RepID=UPI0007FF94A2|nr:MULTISPECIES: hypothetical protein [unclassified Mycobacterium]OBI19588.1 hypothetical protein A5713_01120 [Mycobacterium sp. E2497]
MKDCPLAFFSLVALDNPELLNLPGVAGAWTFSLDRHQDDGLGLRRVGATAARGALRVRVLYLDGESIATARRVRDCVAAAETRLPASTLGQTVISTPLCTIIPWQDW